jgi:hypothetical protein
MKPIISCLIIVFTGLVINPVYAGESFVLYDDFNAKFIDGQKWAGTEGRTGDVILLENVRMAHGGRLRLLNRALGSSILSNTGVSNADNNLRFPDPGAIIAMAASIKVNDVEVTGCTDNPTPTRARARVIGSFFNTGTDLPNGSVNDVLAYTFIHRRSDSTDKPGILEVFGEVVRCADPSCFGVDYINSEKLGDLRLGQWADIVIQWDQANHQFVFQFNKKSPVYMPYPFLDTLPPVIPFKYLGMSQRIANCMGERQLGFMDAEFDNIFVNE